jgi:two-component system phosphate regulon sensor histidine kinase PhoR
MWWLLPSLLTIAAALALHWWWRARLVRQRQACHAEIEALRKIQEQSASRARSQQEALFKSMAEGVLLLDDRGRILLANPALNRLFGVTTDIRSRTLIEALRLHELADLAESLAGRELTVEKGLRILHPSERWVQVNGSAILNDAGERAGAVLVFHDLTRLKQLEAARKEFVANVSHELRTPLSLIKGYIETLNDGAMHSPELCGKFLQIISRNADRLELLIEDLLVISELESGRVHLDLQPVSLRGAVRRVFEDFRTRADAKSISLVDETPDATLRADPGRLEQVLGNLVDNAIKYGRDGGTVVVRARPLEKNEMEICVEDDGPGIPSGSLERVFERFYRVDKARSREQGGTGLGLSIVKHIVQSHGGRVWARSELGEGAAFFFTLPVEPGAGAPTSSVTPLAGPTGAGRQERC